MGDRRTEQLRVRISREQREVLENLARHSGKNEKLSDVVRHLINSAVERSSSESVHIPDSIRAQLLQLAHESERPIEQVLADCVEGLVAMLDGDDRLPLLIEEIRLRRRYLAEVGRGGASRDHGSLKT